MKIQVLRKKSIQTSPVFVTVFIIIPALACCAFFIRPQKDKNNISSYFSETLKVLKQETEQFHQLSVLEASPKKLIDQFFKTRQAYKKLAVLTDYFNPLETKNLNAPALSRVEEDNPDVVISPHGFQLIEELIFHKKNHLFYASLVSESEFILKILVQLENETDRNLKFKDEHVFEALRSSMIGLISLGITGYDSPIAKNSIHEAMATLSGIESVLKLYAESIREKDEELYKANTSLFSKAKTYLLTHPGFNTFDRLYFITQFADPLFLQLKKTRDLLGIPPLSGRRPFTNASSVFAAGAFNIDFFSPGQYEPTPERIQLGKKLFNDSILSFDKTRSCGSCHRPELAFTDGLTVPKNIDGKTLLTRNTPTLLNSAFQTRQFYDSRTDLLENQLDEVVHNASEMKGSLKQSAIDLKKDPTYRTLFKKAYAEDSETISAYNIANAISSYVRSLVSLNSKFDQYMRGNTNALNAEEKKGFNLFAGKANCASCHFIPLFNGLRPPEFNETESEVLGVPQKNRKEKAVIDPDQGKFNFTRATVHRYAFKTPSLRNIALTSPYMHNGVFKTLEEVIDFYNEAGGYGWHTAPENQTLSKEKLHLSVAEKKQLIAFLKSLTDR